MWSSSSESECCGGSGCPCVDGRGPWIIILLSDRYVPGALCYVPGALCYVPGALCYVPGALCSFPGALCYVPGALCS